MIKFILWAKYLLTSRQRTPDNPHLAPWASASQSQLLFPQECPSVPVTTEKSLWHFIKHSKPSLLAKKNSTATQNANGSSVILIPLLILYHIGLPYFTHTWQWGNLYRQTCCSNKAYDFNAHGAPDTTTSTNYVSLYMCEGGFVFTQPS